MTLIIPNQALHLQKIKDNPGILPVRQGNAYNQEDQWIIIKVLDLSGIANDLDFHVAQYDVFTKIIDKKTDYINEFLGIRTQFENLRSNTIYKFRQLFPSHKVKRGLVDPLGSLIKLISGNLDSQDAVRYDSLISQIQAKQISTDKKITLVTKVFDSLVNSTDTLQENLETLNKRLKRIEDFANAVSDRQNNCLYTSYVLSMFDMFINVFTTTYTTLNEIETALAFSKVSVLHQSIVNTTELLSLLKAIERVDNLMYEASEENMLKLERIITVKAYIKKSQISFILEVPLIEKEVYNYYKLYPIPIFNDSINKTLIVFPESPYLMVKGWKFLPVTTPCQRVAADDSFLCSEENVVPFTGPSCEEQLMTFQTNLDQCTPYSVEIEDIKVQRITLDSWTVFCRNPTVLMERCGNEEIRKSFQGTYIITTKKECIIHLSKYRLSYRKTLAENIRFEITPITAVPEFKRENITNLKPINIKGISLGETRQLINLLRAQADSESVKVPKVYSVESVTLSVCTIVFYILIVLIIISFITFRLYKRLQNYRNPTSISVEPDNFALEEGGVMMQLPSRVITTVST